MNPKQSFYRYALLTIAALAAIIVAMLAAAPDITAQIDRQNPFVSPLPTPLASAEPLSREAKIALAYLATQHNLPAAELQIVNEHQRSYPLIGRTFKAFTVWTTGSAKFQEFNLFVELETGAVEAGVNAIVAAEDAVYRARYGKLHPDLYERVQKTGTDELLPVAIWLAPDPTLHTQAQVFAELVERYPDAADALAEKSVPWAVADTALAEEIRQTYFRTLSIDAARRMQPLVEQVKSLGAEATTLEPMPSLFARLSKSAILALADREDIDLIYLVESQVIPAMAEAAATDRMPATWYQGSLSGAGRRVAVLEPSNIQNTGCLNIIASRSGVPPASWTQDQIEHKTRVTSVLACNDTIYRGIAYNTNVIDAGYNSTNFNPDFATGVQWAVQAQNADVVNVSLATNSSQSMQWEDRVLDYWGRFGPASIVTAAGNDTINVISPGKGWNVITVGAIDDQGNSNWADDVLADFSNYINPTTTHGDHEKPDFAAPGVNITLVGPGGTLTTRSGTSYAAPQVAGLAALLMNRNGGLVDRPEAVKAILMASAAHNVRDSRVMPSSQDLRDGAGSIDAALALQTAELGYGTNNNTTCDRPCWWATDTLYVAPGGSFTRSFQAGRGERIRVAIAWLSLVDPLYATDTLGVDYNLQVLAPSGGQVTDGYSASWDNSNELVEFVAPESGTYTIRMIRSSSDTSSQSTDIGIAWSKQATYLPDVREDDGGWDSSITIRNDGAEPRSVSITYYRENGNHFETVTTGTLNPNATWTTAPSATFNGRGSAIVDGSQDLSVVVESIYDSSGRYLAAAYPGETAPATTVYVPFFLKKWPTLNSQWRQTSELMIHNTGSQSAGVTVTIYDSWDSDSGSASLSYTIPAGGRQSVPATHFSQNWDYGGFLAAARVSTTSGQPLAVVVNTLTGLADGNGVITTPYLAGSYRAESRPANFLYASTTGREYNGYDSSLQVQNAGAITTTFRLKYYWLNTGTPTLTLDKVVGPYRSANFWRPPGMPFGFFGSATVEVLSGGPLAVMAQYDRFDVANSRYGVTQYEGVSSLNSSLGIAHIQKSSPWTYTGIQAQNMNSSAANIQLHYFKTDGTNFVPAASATKPNVPVNAAVNFWWTTGSPPEIPGGLNGSSVGSPAHLALLVSFDRSGDPTYQNKDGMMGYAAVK